jgi:HK97 family phage major capsid protein
VVDKLLNTKESATLSITIKSAVDIGLNNTIEAVGSESEISITRNTGIISAIRQRVTKYLSGGVSVSSLGNSNKAMWIEELDEQGNPIFIGEGDPKTKISVRYEERDKKARKIAVYGKITTEFLRNLPSLVNYVKNNMMKRVDIKTEDQLFDGDDTGDNLAGIIDYASAFTGGGLTTTSPTYADVFRAIALQVEKANGQATAVYVKPQILAEMDVEKSTDDGHYIIPPFRSPLTGNTVAGIKIISSNALNSITEDFVGGDLSVVNVMFSDALRMEVGRSGDDMINNKLTILVEQELVQFVSANDTQVLVKGTMSTAIASITAS